MSNDLLASLQRLGDAEHDDLSVAHDALAEIVGLRLEVERLKSNQRAMAALADERSRETFEARADERTAMGYLAGVRQVVGGEDFPDMVRRVREKIDSADLCHEAVTLARQTLADHFGGNLAFLDDDLIRGVVTMHEELEAIYDLLPGSYYMDPPDGGDVPLLEQLRRMAEDAKLWRTHKAMEASNAG